MIKRGTVNVTGSWRYSTQRVGGKSRFFTEQFAQGFGRGPVEDRFSVFIFGFGISAVRQECADDLRLGGFGLVSAAAASACVLDGQVKGR